MKNSTIEQAAQGIQRRVTELADKFTQSELSRRTGAAVSNVNRYMNGTRVPADFCAALVQGFGVNPAWLLNGEGAPYLSDVSDQTSRMAGDMLELVEALNAVTRMRVGSLAGKHHLRVLRELNDALNIYRGLRDKLNQRSGPILEQLTADMGRASARHDWEQAADLRRAGEQIADFCHDNELLRSFHAAAAIVEFSNGTPERALEMTREVFARTLTGTDSLTPNAMTQAYNLVVTLGQHYLFAEARRVVRAALELAGDQHRDQQVWYELSTLAGVMDVECGFLKDGLPRLATSYSRGRELHTLRSVSIVLRGFYMAGLVTFEEMDGRKEMGFGKSRHLRRFAIWLEEPAKLEHVLKQYGPETTPGAPLLFETVHAPLLLAALRKPGKAALAKGLRKLAEADVTLVAAPIAAVIRATYSAQLSQVHGDAATAADFVMATEAAVNALKPEVSPDMLTRAMIHRNAIRALGAHATGARAGILERARAFMAEHLRKGYNFLLAPQ